MAVFRLNQKKGTAARPTSGKEDQDWFVSSRIEPSNIHDSEGGKGNEPTSIPSPFARMDLIRTALAYVAEKNMDDKNRQNEGDITTFHKLVSDYLDVAEIFFNFKNWAGDGSLKILEWKRGEDLGWLKKSALKGHKLFGEALELYLSQDKEAFNFGSSDSIYLLEYKRSRIIGATSPKTLFFTCGNDLSGIRDLVFPNQDKAFDNVYTPLHMRDLDFQKWLFSLRRLIKGLGQINNFKEFNSYLDSTLKKLENGDKEQHNLYDELMGAKDSYCDTNYYKIGDGIFFTKDIPLLCGKGQPDFYSDFKMAPTKPEWSSKEVQDRIPLVLKKGHSGKDSMGQAMIYYKSAYVDTKEIGHYDNIEDIYARKLPGLRNVVYPYLTVSDFLEPYLIQTNYSLNKIRFFDALREKPADSPPIGFIIPLKRRFFDYFSIDHLVYSDRRTQPYIDIQYTGKHSSVKVKLGIPIMKGRYIEYSRLYSYDLRPNLDENTGMVAERHFTVAVFPFFKVEQKSLNFMRVGLVDRDLGHNTTEVSSLNFFEETSQKALEVTIRKRNDLKSSSAAPATTSHHVIEKTGFDYMEVAFPDGPRGIIIPILKKISSVGGDPIKFAVDFGTTNTHIEYRKGEHESQIEPLQITAQDIQLECLHDSFQLGKEGISEEIKSDLSQFEFVALTELIPREISRDSLSGYKFPIRTAIARSPYLNMDGEIYAMADMNIPFYFEKIHSPSSRIDPDLKWSNYEKKSESLKKFIENLLLLIRNKAILSSSSLENTEVTWFYPNSMAIGKRDILKSLWNELYKKYITTKHNPSSLSESVAPFYWISQKCGVTAAQRPVLSIDIGGETTDAILFVRENNKQVPKLATSFRFAGNAVFGDGYNNQKANNGFLRTFLPKIKDELLAKGRKDTKELLEEIERTYPSRDVIAMLFSLDGTTGLPEEKKVSFNKKLYEDQDYKTVFLLFYTSVMYHLGKLIKKAGYDFPEYIAFTGNGSKILNIIDPIDGTLLKELAYKMFSVVADGQFVPEPTIKRFDDAKEITCKGGVRFNPDKDEVEEIRNIIIVYPGGDLDLTWPAITTESNLALDKLSDSDDNAILDEFVGYLNAVIKEKYYLKEKFLIEPAKLSDSIDCLKQSMTEYLKLGKILRHNAEEKELTETLFFYPLIGGLNKLAEIISKEKK